MLFKTSDLLSNSWAAPESVRSANTTEAIFAISSPPSRCGYGTLVVVPSAVCDSSREEYGESVRGDHSQNHCGI